MLVSTEVKKRVENGSPEGGETWEARDLVAGSVIRAFDLINVGEEEGRNYNQ